MNAKQFNEINSKLKNLEIISDKKNEPSQLDLIQCHIFPPQFIAIRNYHIKLVDNSKPNFFRPNQIISVRHEIRNFTQRSASRMKMFLSKIDFDYYQTKFFFTCTFGKEFPQTKLELKHYLNALLKRIERMAVEKFVVWRVELQRRNAPHFHLLIFIREKFNGEEMKELAKKLKSFWNDLTLQINPNSSNVNSDLRTVYDYNVLSYLSKYLAKKTNDCDNEIMLGRWWGKRGKYREAEIKYYSCSKKFQETFKTLFISQIKNQECLKNEYLDYLYFSREVDICKNQIQLFELINQTILETKELPIEISKSDSILVFMQNFSNSQFKKS